MELTDYDPWPAVGGAKDFASFMKRATPESDEHWKPVLEAFHDDRALVLRFELAGVDPKDIDVCVDNRVLYVRGVRRADARPPAELLLRDERTYGPFDRSIALPEGTDGQGIQASLRNGVLEVRVPHARRPAARAVPVSVEHLESVAVDITHGA